VSGLTTHVLDLAHGRPAAKVKVRLLKEGRLLASFETNADGRSPADILPAKAMTAGEYRLEFDVGDYFRHAGLNLPQPAFLETVTIQFGVADPAQSYHVPLLVSPYGYSTYRGS
jgi:5-hydroxyisourate hydrolase